MFSCLQFFPPWAYLVWTRIYTTFRQAAGLFETAFRLFPILGVGYIFTDLWHSVSRSLEENMDLTLDMTEGDGFWAWLASLLAGMMPLVLDVPA